MKKVKIRIHYNPISNTKLLFVFCFGFIFLSTISCRLLFPSLVDKFKSPVLFYGYCEHTMTSVTLVLRQDKTFEYDVGAFLKTEVLYGNYQIINDTVTLNFSNKKQYSVADKLVFTDISLKEIGDSSIHRHNFKFRINEIKNDKSRVIF